MLQAGAVGQTGTRHVSSPQQREHAAAGDAVLS